MHYVQSAFKVQTSRDRQLAKVWGKLATAATAELGYARAVALAGKILERDAQRRRLALARR